MLIIKMIMRITGFNQEELAKFLEVSRASVNSWVNSNSDMTAYQKKIISSKFNIPIDYLNTNLDEDIEVYKKMYITIERNWQYYKSSKSISKEDELLNLIEYQLKLSEENMQLTDKEIIDSLTKGFNPYTGEIYEEEHILNDIQVKNFLVNLKNKYYKHGVYNMTKEDLSENERELFEELRKWRKDMAEQEGFFRPYLVFSDKELINIITSNVSSKKDLLNIKGIANIKYEKYGDDIFYILKTHKYDFNMHYLND